MVVVLVDAHGLAEPQGLRFVKTAKACDNIELMERGMGPGEELINVLTIKDVRRMEYDV